MIKKSSRIKYTYGEDQLNIKEIYSRNKKRRGRSRYLLSVDVMVGKENPIPAKIVCVRNKGQFVRIGLLSYAQIHRSPKEESSASMANAGKSSLFQRPASLC